MGVEVAHYLDDNSMALINPWKWKATYLYSYRYLDLVDGSGTYLLDRPPPPVLWCGRMTRNRLVGRCRSKLSVPDTQSLTTRFSQLYSYSYSQQGKIDSNCLLTMEEAIYRLPRLAIPKKVSDHPHPIHSTTPRKHFSHHYRLISIPQFFDGSNKQDKHYLT